MEKEPLPSFKIMRLDWAMLGVNAAIRFLGATQETLCELGSLVGSQINYNRDQEVFHEEAALEIETLVAGEQDDEEEQWQE